MNSYGVLFRITTFGESHGLVMGVVVDGCPAGLTIDESFIQSELDRRRPGQSRITTARKERDKLEVWSGVFEGKTTGAPIVLVVRNEDKRSEDYTHLSTAFRPSHADYTYALKYGVRDYRGGGRSSARETVARVAAGAIAKLILRHYKVRISAYVSQVGNIKTPPYTELDVEKRMDNMVCCPDEAIANDMIELIDAVRKKGDTIGGAITCIIKDVPAGLGEPVFAKLHAELGKAMLSINAVKGFEYGSGFSGIQLQGSTHNDAFYVDDGSVRTKTNYSGGIQGGISNGEDIYFNVAFKPVSTLMQSQQSVDSRGKEVVLAGKGRHDACVVPRAVPIVEAMAALVVTDFLLLQRARRNII